MKAPGDRNTQAPRPVRAIYSAPLLGLFLLALFAALKVAKSLFLPIFLAFFLLILLAPIVRFLERLRIPRALGAGIVLALLLGGLGWGAYRTIEPARKWLEKAPEDLAQVERRLRSMREPVEQVAEAAEQVEKITKVGEEASTARQVELREPTLLETALSGTQETVAGLLITLVLAYFLLASGDALLLKLLAVLPRRIDPRRAAVLLRRMERDAALQLGLTSLINAVLGVAVGAALYGLGLPNPVLWGVMAALLNFVPYLGAVVGTFIIGVAAIVTFDTLWTALLSPATYLALTSIEGTLVRPLLLGRRLQLSAVAVFLGIVFWGWLWGIAGTLLAVPILTTVKVVLDAEPSLSKWGKLLGP